MDGTIIGNKSLSSFDVLVVGSGAGGAAVASVLASAGKKVLVLEAGANRYSGLDNPDPAKLTTQFANDELKLLRRNFIMPDPTVEPRTFRASASSAKRDFVGDVNTLPKTVGGAAVHADVKTPRFAPNDFKLGTLVGAIPGTAFADWPVGYDELEPYYGYAERALGVQGVMGSDPSAGPRSSPYPMAPGVPMYLGLKVSDAATRLGYHPFPYPMAITSKPYRGRPACASCGWCGDFGCTIHAKGSPAVTLLRDALLTGNCQLHSETRAIQLTVSGGAVTGVVAIGPDGKRQTFTADRYVLACSPIEDARLVLLSDGIGNSSGLVGRHLMFHFQTFGVGIFDERLHGHRGPVTTHGMSDFRGVPGDLNRPMGGIVEFGGPAQVVSEAITYVSQLGAIGAQLKKLIRQSPLRDRLAVLTMQAEDAPQPTNRVDLDPEVRDLDGLPAPRITYSNHAWELGTRQFYAPKLKELLTTAGARFAFIAPPDTISTSRHVFGTLRFGTDPKTSVCDKDGKFHDLANLYGAGSSLFPTSSGYNPFLTIVSLATRVGAAMVNPQSPQSAIPQI
jgi:gluconate 2-dehydrogenase alpha chain